MSQVVSVQRGGVPGATDSGLPAASRLGRLVAMAMGAAMALVAIGTIGAVLFAADQPYWMVVGFEVVVVVAGVYGLLIGRGKFGDGPGMALLSMAGVFFVAGVLGYLSTKATQSSIVLHGRSIPMKPWALLHMGAAGVLGVTAAYEVLRRDSRSLYYLARAAMAGVPLAALGIAAWFFNRHGSIGSGPQPINASPGASLPTSAPALPPSGSTVPSWLLWVGMFVGCVVGLVLFCACAHCLIRAFEMGRAKTARE